MVQEPILVSYRQLLRQVRKLPDQYVRVFYRIKIADDYRRCLSPQTDKSIRLIRIRKLNKELTRLERANTGCYRDLRHVLNYAYGRKGPLKWNLYRSLQTSFEARPPPRIIPSHERSRPPAYSPALTALLTSRFAVGRSRATTQTNLKKPPIMPQRVDPKSEEARLFGPLSKRREVNLHWRYFKLQRGKLRIPLSLSEEGPPAPDGSAIQRAAHTFGLHGVNMLEDVARFAGRHGTRPPLPRRQQKAPSDTIEGSFSEAVAHGHPPGAAISRQLRRRYRKLLRDLPTLTLIRKSRKHTQAGSAPEDYRVSLHPNALPSSSQRNPEQLPDGDFVDSAWAQRSGGSAVDGGGKRRARKQKQKQEQKIQKSK
ncbi:hypothetical protein EVG20_g3688 [Dentipellis fragilis]|uniref:LYR motif-containing protein Cup1-like N-terminal domain-containing protein n=1 Tax=Dentipellis fragilis TaxID=205917 RepID=A0A4Y9Z2L9_9AGAM|nr:hypothetical protein EVG20_g3688 [Dentipellis fragilis]